MGIESGRYIARLQTDPQYRSVMPDVAATARVLVAGYHAAFATPPQSGTSIGVFPGVDPVPAKTGVVTTSQKMLARIGALLRIAEGTDNQYEAKAFLAMAHRLATQHSIDLNQRGPPLAGLLGMGRVSFAVRRGARSMRTLSVVVMTNTRSPRFLSQSAGTRK